MARAKKRLKEHRARALFDAASCDLAGEKLRTAAFLPVKTACQKRFSVTRSVFLQFSKSIHLHSARLDKWCRKAQAVLLPKSKRQLPTFLLYLVFYCSRAAHTAADLMHTPSSCSSHHAHRMRLSCLLETRWHSGGYDSPSSTAHEPLSALGPCCGLPVLPRRQHRSATGGRTGCRSAKYGHFIEHTLYTGCRPFFLSSRTCGVDSTGL